MSPAHNPHQQSFQNDLQYDELQTERRACWPKLLQNLQNVFFTERPFS